MNKRSVSGENRRFDRRAFAVEGAPIERNVNDIFEVQINCVGCDCVTKSIERFLQRDLKFSKDTYDFVNSRLIHQAVRSPDDQTNIFVKLDGRWKLHVVIPLIPPEWFATRGFAASSSSETPSHFA